MSFIEDLKTLLEQPKGDKKRSEKTVKMYIANIKKLYKILDFEDEMI